jgi:type IV pilus assembly protein PilM
MAAPKTQIGLDIGSMSIRAVETTRGKDGPVVTNFGEALLLDGAVDSGVIQNPEMVTAALRHLWAEARFGGRDVALGVTNPQVVIREMTVADLPRRELRRSLPFQVRDLLPLAVDRSLLDFYPLAEPDDRRMVRGLLVAAPKEPVLAAIRAVEQAGLRVVRVDVAALALLRAASYLDGQVEALVDIGTDATMVVVHDDGAPLIVRTIPRGGSEITSRIAAGLDLTKADAEALKCKVGLSDGGPPGTAEAVRDALRPLLNEITSSFAYLGTGDRPVRVGRLALSGGGSLLPGLPDALREQLDIAVVPADPLIRVREPQPGRFAGDPRFRSSAAVSVGLTLGAA